MTTNVQPSEYRISVDYATYLALLDIRATVRETLLIEGWTDAERLDWLRGRLAELDTKVDR